MKIEFSYDEANKFLIIKWGEGLKNTKTLQITKDEDIDLNDLYDFIIENVEAVYFDKTSLQELNEESVALKSARAIINAIESETNEILEECKNILNIEILNQNTK